MYCWKNKKCRRWPWLLYIYHVCGRLETRRIVEAVCKYVCAAVYVRDCVMFIGLTKKYDKLRYCNNKKITSHY